MTLRTMLSRDDGRKRDQRGHAGAKGGLRRSLLVISPYPARLCGVAEYTHQIIRRLPDDLTCRTSTLDLRLGVRAYVRDAGSAIVKMWRMRPDCVHVQYTPTTSGPMLPFIVWFARRAVGTRVVLTAHERPSTYERKLAKPFAAAFRVWEGLSVKAAHRVVVLSRQHQRELRDRYGIGSELLHLGLDSQAASSTAAVNVADGRKRNITFAGFVRPSKGVDDLLRAVPLITERIGPVSVNIIGAIAERDRPYAAELRRVIAGIERGGACSIEMTGAIPEDEFRRRILDAGVFVFPFRTVSQSITFNEVVAAGIPVVAADAGGVGEIVADHGVGLTYPAGDVPALADAVCRLFEDRELLAACRERARIYAVSSDWRVIAGQHVELYGLRDAA